jgi:hypothetical protein
MGGKSRRGRVNCGKKCGAKIGISAHFASVYDFHRIFLKN